MGKVCSTIVEHRHDGQGDSSSSLSSLGMCQANDRMTPNLGVKKLPTPVRSSFLESRLAPPVGSVISPEGRRRSLLVGINYYDTQDQLVGCVNDALRMVPVLARAGFPCNSENQRVLTDGPRADPDQRPTRANILEGLEWLVEGAEKGDALFFHYSGHGGRNGSTSTRQFRETLVPVDFESAGLLDEEVVSKELVEKLPEGCRLTCLIDSAHGAGAPLGMPSMFIGDSNTIGAVKHGGAAMGRGVQKATSFSKRRGEPMQPAAEVLVITSREKELRSWSNRGPESEERLRKKRIGTSTEGAITIPSDISVPSGALYIDPSRAPGGSNWGLGGVLTSAFTEVLSRPKEDALTLLAVMDKINQEFTNRGYMQVPLMAASKILDLKQRLELDTWLC